MRDTRAEVLARLRAQTAEGRAIVGAGAGTGISAKFAEAGGADLIIIYNSGRFRMAGHGSLAGVLAFGDANAPASRGRISIVSWALRSLVAHWIGPGSRFRRTSTRPSMAYGAGRPVLDGGAWRGEGACQLPMRRCGPPDRRGVGGITGQDATQLG